MGEFPDELHGFRASFGTWCARAPHEPCATWGRWFDDARRTAEYGGLGKRNQLRAARYVAATFLALVDDDPAPD